MQVIQPNRKICDFECQQVGQPDPCIRHIYGVVFDCAAGPSCTQQTRIGLTSMGNLAPCLFRIGWAVVVDGR
jgi:hypothetical protein